MERDPFDVELEMLRDFYGKWVDFHKIPRDKLHHRKMETAAQSMVDAAHVLHEFYTPSQIKLAS